MGEGRASESNLLKNWFNLLAQTWSPDSGPSLLAVLHLVIVFSPLHTVAEQVPQVNGMYHSVPILPDGHRNMGKDHKKLSTLTES